MANQAVVFRVGDQTYAIDIRCVFEVVNWLAPTPIPNAPPAVLGVLSLRDRVVPVMDLGARFRVPRRRADADARIMVIGVRDQVVGLVVDEVVEVLQFKAEDVEPPGAVLHNPRDPVVGGVIRLEGGKLVIFLRENEITRGVVADDGSTGETGAAAGTATAVAAAAMEDLP